MPYSELIKNMEHIRSYLRDFYVFGFKSREDYGDGAKSRRSYDDERRRLESWLGEHMSFRRTSEGKYAFISIDSRVVRHDPLYRAWKAKSFTAGDITLHFVLLDILTDAEEPLPLSAVMERLDAHLSHFESPLLLDESTVRKKLREYADEGLVTVTRAGKRSVYALCTDGDVQPSDALLDFYSEVAPCGVIGSFLLDRVPRGREAFAFKHHYITAAIDSGVLCALFEAMTREAYADITVMGHRRRVPRTVRVVPLQIFLSVQNGRQYLLAWHSAGRRIISYRVDYILAVERGERCETVAEHRARLAACRTHMWGVICGGKENRLQHVEFTVHAADNEPYIYARLMREKRCGRVERLDRNTYRFSADVYDINEMVPWIRTFLCRITALSMSDKRLEEKFKRDIVNMYRLYDMEETHDE